MIKLTKKRASVFNVIKNNKKPINAEEIFEVLGSNNINLSTVYRAIDYLLENNLLLSFHFNNKTYYISNDIKNHYHFFICTKCLYMEKVDCHLTDTIKNLKQNKNYTVTNHEMTIYGLCNNCN